MHQEKVAFFFCLLLWSFFLKRRICQKQNFTGEPKNCYHQIYCHHIGELLVCQVYTFYYTCNTNYNNVYYMMMTNLYLYHEYINYYYIVYYGMNVVIYVLTINECSSCYMSCYVMKYGM